MASSDNKRWQIAHKIPSDVEQSLLGFSPILRQILYNRGYATPEAATQYLEARPLPGCEPANMLGIAQSVEHIRRAIQKQELIAVYGDYDADGVTATALLTQALLSLGARVQGYIPNRFEEGYGLNIEALDTLRQAGTQLVITVDCGIRSPAEANHARRNGLDLIITDHHTPGEEIPEAIALINPKQSGDAYPDKHLAGVGLAYKLADALLQQSGPNSSSPESDSPAASYLDLVALGTITDLAPLTGENRALVRRGLNFLRRPQRQGVMSLIGVSQINPAQINAENVSFALGPRLNAAGRLDSALAALKLLLTNDVQEAAYLAQLLDNQNRERQQITRQIQAHAEQTVLSEDAEALLLFAVDENYNPGVIGLAASKLSESYYRPAIVAHRGEEFTRGSCRSIPEFHITHALDQCADLLVRHGGHSAAAGFTVRNELLPELIQRLKDSARQQLGALDLRPTLLADVEIEFSQLKPDLLKDLNRLQPVGHGNPQAVFVSRNAKVTRSRPVGKDNAHLKLTVTDGRIFYDAIAFRLGHRQVQQGSMIDLMYTFEVNEYNGHSTLQLNVRDLKPAGLDDEQRP